MRYTIGGTTMPTLRVDLDAGETITAEPGEFAWMSDTIRLRTTTQAAGVRSFFGALSRATAGGGFVMTHYAAEGAAGFVTFAAKIPGAIIPLELNGRDSLLVHRHGFLCATPDVTLALGFQQKLGVGLFGGQGFLLQRLGGTGTAFLELGGEMVVHDLAPGESLQVHPGHIGAFQESVNFEIVFLKGIRNMLFGGDGLFVARMTGPGRIWLQSLTVPGLAHSLQPYLSQGETAGAGAGLLAGSMLKS